MDREVLYFKASRMTVAQPFPSEDDKDGIVEWLETNGFVKWDRLDYRGFSHDGLLEFMDEHKRLKGAYTIGSCNPKEDLSFWIRFCTRKDAENKYVYFCRLDGKTGVRSLEDYAYVNLFENVRINFNTFSEFSEYVDKNIDI